MKSKYLNLTLASAIFVASSIVNVASASLETLEFNNGDSLGDWFVDRAAPAGFQIINNELVMTVAGDLQPDAFHDTQGMQLDIGQSNYMSIDMWIGSEWDVAGRYGGMWGIGYNSPVHSTANRTDEYPILEFQNNHTDGTGVAKWESGLGWVVPPSSLFTLDAFNTLEITLIDNMFEYFVNGNLVHQAAAVADHLGTVILNGYNTQSGNAGGYEVRYDNLTFGTVDVPEPSTLAVFALAFAALGSRRFCKK
ncbi:PEP-CTERM sorting domain-containing protein [Paraglaciecola arctica]|uniref:PEP-CTERM sorting domain-containing protein n=1 Tax=Paraglaciecola arctica TaxID=1128911 RepID=UPI001C071CEA|nr:PEP-CTERM sorting domain-containing protein [Paraglaciecola arctica]MBU3003110.1 PEP-CTERM sorting domain-containing protein [Paraglaciecola arctica]